MQYNISNLHGTSYFDSKIILVFHIEYLKVIEEPCIFINQHFFYHALQLKENTLSNLLIDAVQSYLQGSTAFPYEVIRKIIITNNHNFVFSGYFDDYIFSGGAHGNTIRHSFTFLVNCGESVSLLISDFQIAPKNKEEIIDTIIKQIQESNTEDQYFSNYRELLFKHFNQKNFYVDHNGIIIFYQLYEIAPYSMGIPIFHIPFTS